MIDGKEASAEADNRYQDSHYRTVLRNLIQPRQVSRVPNLISTFTNQFNQQR
jgi:hypothetical protein